MNRENYLTSLIDGDLRIAIREVLKIIKQNLRKELEIHLGADHLTVLNPAIAKKCCSGCRLHPKMPTCLKNETT